MDILKTAETIQSGAAGIYNRLSAIADGGSLTPAARLTIDGKPFGTDAQSRIISINLTDKSGFEADELTVTLSDHDGRLAFPPISAEIRLFLGYKETGLVDKGSYKITELSWSGAPDTLTLTALAADVSDKFSEARERSWHKTDLKKIIETIAAEHGYIPIVGKAWQSEKIAHIDQSNESNAAFCSFPPVKPPPPTANRFPPSASSAKAATATASSRPTPKATTACAPTTSTAKPTKNTKSS